MATDLVMHCDKKRWKQFLDFLGQLPLIKKSQVTAVVVETTHGNIRYILDKEKRKCIGLKQ